MAEIGERVHGMISATRQRTDGECSSVYAGVEGLPESVMFNRTGAACVVKAQVQELANITHLLENGLITEKKGRYILRGPSFYRVIDPFLETAEIIGEMQDILDSAQDEKSSHLESVVYIDYIKHVLLYLQNSIFDSSSRDEALYEITQPILVKLISQTKDAIEDYYNSITTGEKPRLKEHADKLMIHLDSYRDVYAHLPRASFRVAESAHPQRMLTTSLAIVQEAPQAQWVLGVPVGGTEAAYVLDYVYAARGYDIPLHFLPISLHSRAHSNSANPYKAKLAEKLQVGSKGVIIDDSTASGSTLAKIEECVKGVGACADTFVVEADISRMRMLDRRKEGTGEDFLGNLNLGYVSASSGVLSVTRGPHKHGWYVAGSNLVNEGARAALGNEHLKKETAVSTPEERLVLKAREHLIRLPSDRIASWIRSGKKEGVTMFRGSELSNFWPVDIQLGADTYPSSEHAYQYMKLRRNGISELSETVREEHKLPNASLHDIFMDPHVSPGTIKRVVRSVAAESDLPVDKATALRDMAICLVRKFQDPIMRNVLIQTGDMLLVEGNDWDDTMWGMTLDESGYPKEGFNMLGRMLMCLRSQILLEDSEVSNSNKHSEPEIL